jgi:uncharacterized phage protein (TIGR02216 family)
MARASPAPFPWGEALSFGLGILRLSSHEFWNMTPREFSAAREAHLGRPAVTFDRMTFAHLMRQFPDVFGSKDKIHG